MKKVERLNVIRLTDQEVAMIAEALALVVIQGGDNADKAPTLACKILTQASKGRGKK